MEDFTQEELQEIVGMTIERTAHYDGIIKAHGKDPANASMVEVAKKKRDVVGSIQLKTMQRLGIR